VLRALESHERQSIVLALLVEQAEMRQRPEQLDRVRTVARKNFLNLVEDRVVIRVGLRDDGRRESREHEGRGWRGDRLERPAQVERDHAHLRKGCDPSPRTGGYARAMPAEERCGSLTARASTKAIDGCRLAHFHSFDFALQSCGAESLGGGTLVVTAGVVIDEVLEPIAGPRDRAPIRRDEAQRAVGFLHDAEPAFVQRTVVIVAYPPTKSQVTTVPPEYATHQGVFAVPASCIGDYIKAYDPVILRWNRQTQKKLCEDRTAYNWEAKGCAERVLILPPDKHAKFLCGDTTAFDDANTDDAGKVQRCVLARGREYHQRGADMEPRR
jgi:hypothetical protein